MNDLTSARVAFVIQHYIVGAVDYQLGWQLVGNAGTYGGLVATVAQQQSAQPFLKVEVNANHLVHHAVEAVVIQYCALEQHIWLCAVLLAETVEIAHHARVYQCVKTLQQGVVGENTASNCGLVGSAVGAEDSVS